MSATISIITGATLLNGSIFTWPTLTNVVPQSGSHVYTNVQNIPTTAGGTALTVGAGIATLGWALFLNLDPTNYVQVGVQVSGTFYPLWRLPPYVQGKSPPAVLPLDPGVTLYALAHMATCELQYAILEA